MTRLRARTIPVYAATALGLVALLLGGPGLRAQETRVYDNGLFQLDPTIPGNADIIGSPGIPSEAGPDWEDLFDAEGKLRDEAPANGIPDYVDLYGGQWAVFTADDVSRGAAVDFTARQGDRVVNGMVDEQNDLSNAYVYSTFDPLGNLVLYAGAERLSSDDSWIEWEFNQAHIRLGRGGYGRGEPWEITGGNLDGDLLVRLSFEGGFPANLKIWVWDETEGWDRIENFDGEDCNAEQTVCVVANGQEIDGGPWPNFDSGGDPELITPYRFAELGANVGALLGYQPAYTSIQLRTPTDIAFGYFAEGN